LEPQQLKKKSFNLSEITAKKRAEDEAKANERVDDPSSVKLTNVTYDTSEEEILIAMSKFGAIEKVFIPISEENIRKNKIAIVRFKKFSDSDRAIEEKSVTINFSEIKIERALRKNQPDRPFRERTDRPDDRGDRPYGQRSDGKPWEQRPPQ
jgi:RNA recognition motif-containing protein